MTDILAELRMADDDRDRTAPLYEDAANEIERLRAALKKIKSLWHEGSATYEIAKDALEGK